MFKKLLELIKEAIQKMIGYSTLEDTMSTSIYTISPEMQDKIDLWKNMYKDLSPWLDENKGVYSLGLAKAICQNLSNQVLSELNVTFSTGDGKNVEEDEINVRAGYLLDLYKKHLEPHLMTQVEKAMATGGIIIKPYISNNRIYFDFNLQGQFYPLEFDDDGNITDIAFLDQFIDDDKIYTKIERQTFADNKVTVQNKAFVASYRSETDEKAQELGKEIQLTSVARWSGISEEPVIIENVERPLFGYYKIPLSNNIDLDCPLGISVFSPAWSLIKRADMQFSRLDWEYAGGQMAVDIDYTAVKPESTYYGNKFEQDELKDRLYRKADFGNDNAYNVFAPSLRDSNYMQGLNSYKAMIEDACGLARGTISDVQSEARTATEMKILKQRSYITINSNQQALENALLDVLEACDVYATLYNLAPQDDYNVAFDWNDSILTDIDTELEQKLQLVDANVLSKAELRSWYTGEDIDTAQESIDKIKEENNSGLNDIFSANSMFNTGTSLEASGQEESQVEEE